eukprot:6981572-Lingulodinium_polyedra.AAC.1
MVDKLGWVGGIVSVLRRIHCSWFMSIAHGLALNDAVGIALNTALTISHSIGLSTACSTALSTT